MFGFINFGRIFGLNRPVLAPENTSGPYRETILKLMSVFVDSQLAAAAGFVDIMNQCPSVKDKAIAARVVLEKTDNAERFFELMRAFGAATDKYIEHHPWAARMDRNAEVALERADSDMRINVFNYPLKDWTDALVWSVFVGHASNIMIGEFTQMSYRPAAEAFKVIQPIELRHHELASDALADWAAERKFDLAIQESINYWWPRVSASFGRPKSKTEMVLKTFGLRNRDNEAMRNQWVQEMTEFVHSLGFEAGVTWNGDRNSVNAPAAA